MLRPLALAAVAGALYFLAFAGFDLWPLCFIALVPMLWAIDPVGEGAEMSRGRFFLVALTAGVVTNVGGYYWLVQMLENFSGFGFALCVVFASVVWVYQGGQVLMFLWLFRRVRQRWPMLPATLVAPFALCAAEAFYPLLFEHYFAGCLHNVPIAIQVADLGGPLVVTGALAVINAAVYEAARAFRDGEPHPVRQVLTAAGLWLLLLGYGAYRIDQVDELAAAAPKQRVGLVQVNMGIFQKREDPVEGLRRHIDQSAKLIREQPIDLMVWPESAYGWYIPGHVKNVRKILGPVDTPVLFGGLSKRDTDTERRRYNTAFLADKDANIVGTYDKTYLLAFGEYIPLGDWLPVLYEWSPNSSHFTRGDHVKPLKLGRFRLGVLICYEDILPSFVRSAVQEGDPHLLVNITNDAWFGDTHEPWQHLALAKFRSVEHHRALVRVTNSGVSAVVDPVGRVITHSGVFERATLHAEVPMLENDSPFLWLGVWPGWLSWIAVAFFGFIRKHGA